MLGVSEMTANAINCGLRFLVLGLLFFTTWTSDALPDSLDGAPAESEFQSPTPPPQRVADADSVHHSASAVQSWILPLAVVIAVGTAFFVIFTVRSR